MNRKFERWLQPSPAMEPRMNPVRLETSVAGELVEFYSREQLQDAFEAGYDTAIEEEGVW